MSAIVIKRSNNGFWPQLRNLTRPAPTRKVREGHFFLRKMSKGPSSSTSSSWTPTGPNPSFLSKPWMSMFVNSFSSAGPKDKFTVCVEGNIASGKTSLLQHFESNPNTEVCMEPVDKWRNVQGHNTLALMYEDPKRWSLTLQTYVQLTMIQRHLREQKQRVKLMERSIFSAKYCFVENLHNGGVMPDAEFAVLSEWFDWLISYHNVQVDLIVYLRADPEVVHRRIKNRCRNEEVAIPLDYLQALHTLHEDWLVKKPPLFPCPAPVLVLDANQDLPEMLKVYDEKKTEILCGYT